MNTSPSIVTPPRLRLYLLVLQGMFLVVYCSHLVSPISHEQVGLGAFLATVTLLLMSLPHHQI